MESDLSAYKPAPHKTGLNSVRAKAKRQNNVSFKKESSDTSQSTSYQSLQALKNISAHVDEDRERELATEPGWFKKIWGAFQQAIGNR
jgi:hypothetical protein